MTAALVVGLAIVLNVALMSVGILLGQLVEPAFSRPVAPRAIRRAAATTSGPTSSEAPAF